MFKLLCYCDHVQPLVSSQALQKAVTRHYPSPQAVRLQKIDLAKEQQKKKQLIKLAKKRGLDLDERLATVPHWLRNADRPRLKPGKMLMQKQRMGLCGWLGAERCGAAGTTRVS